MTEAKHKPHFKLTTANLTGELWGAFYKDIADNWPRYNGTALYMKN